MLLNKLLFLIAVNFASALIVDSKEVDYCSVSSCKPRKHIMCEFPEPGGDSECGYGHKPYPLTDTQKFDLLAWHNTVRSGVALATSKFVPPGGGFDRRPVSNMLEMTWSKELERFAQRWADQCNVALQREHDQCRNRMPGLLVALLLCGGGVQGHEAVTSHTPFERPRAGVTSRRPDAPTPAPTTPTHTGDQRGILYNSTRLAADSAAKDRASGEQSRLYGRSAATEVTVVEGGESRTATTAESVAAFNASEHTRNQVVAKIAREGVTVSSSSYENVTNFDRGYREVEASTIESSFVSLNTSVDIKRSEMLSSESIDRSMNTNESADEEDTREIIKDDASKDRASNAKVDSSRLGPVGDESLSETNEDGFTEQRTYASVERTVAPSERNAVDSNPLAIRAVVLATDKDNQLEDNGEVEDGDASRVDIIATSSEKSAVTLGSSLRAKKGRRSPTTSMHRDKIAVGAVTVSSVERSASWPATEAATGEALWDARRRQRQATAQQEEATEMIPACRKFVEGNPERREFYSPNFPGNYPNNTDCVKVLAAEPGHLLRLDFRDEFHVEPSEGCKFDYLEVRDGAHGYENLIGTFCGKDFPPMMTSSGRYLWLRFHSDENIEYSGFSAVFESIPKPTTEMDVYELPECVIEVGGSEGFLNTTSDIELERKRIVAHYNLKLECMWIIRVKPGWKIQLSFLKFELAKPNDCVSNFVDVFSDRTDLPSRLKSFCGSIADMVQAKSHVLHVRFLAEAKAINSSFVALFTAFRDSKLSGSVCTKDEFDCQDETCISSALRCNGRINCRFRWDEDECSTKISPMEKILRSDHIIIILVVFSLIMFGMCFAFVFNCVRKLMHDHKVIKENFRASREGRLDEVGVKLPSPRQPSVDSSVASRRPSAAPGVGVGVGPECYVPGTLLPILVGQTTESVPRPSNGDAVFARRDAEHSETDDDDDDDDAMIGFPAPEMRDNECQTRESLFHCSDRSATPPPPPPPAMARHHHHHHPPQPPVGQFSTFGYTRDNRREDRVKEPPPPPRHPPAATATTATTPTAESARFRAEAVIEMEGRAFSVDSTKSAPDVIVTH